MIAQALVAALVSPGGAGSHNYASHDAPTKQGSGAGQAMVMGHPKVAQANRVAARGGDPDAPGSGTLPMADSIDPARAGAPSVVGAGDNPHAAQDWFYGQRARPYPAIPAMAWTGALRRRSSLPLLYNMPYRAGLRVLAATSWTAIGPAPTGAAPNTDVFGNNSGRVTALAYDASNNILYAGAAEGGLWKTADSGSTWTPLTDNQPSLAVGTITIDPTRPQTLYVGTGEPNNNGDGYYGAGILKTTDGGVSWSLLGADAGIFGGGRYATHYGTTISRITVDPNNAQHILVGASAAQA